VTLLDERARGVFVIAATPFRPDGALDLGGVPRLVEFYRARGATGLTILGIMGEAPKLTAGEALALARAFVAASEGLPVVVGVSAPGFAAMGELAKAVMDAGAAGVMVAPVAGLRGDEAVFSYVAQADEVLGDIPWVLQDYPQASGTVIPVAVIAKSIREFPRLVMLKHEDWPGLAKLSAVRALPGRRISILTGNGGLFLTEEMRRGADGAMTGFAYPEMMAGVVAASEAGEWQRAADIFDAYLPLARYEQQPGTGLAVRKHVLAKRGALASAAMRKPAPSLSAADVAEIEFLIARQERRLAELGVS
jgi:4-hydroxy-tetrahydrodipicolinate synthase